MSKFPYLRFRNVVEVFIKKLKYVTRNYIYIFSVNMEEFCIHVIGSNKSKHIIDTGRNFYKQIIYGPRQIQMKAYSIALKIEKLLIEGV